MRRSFSLAALIIVASFLNLSGTSQNWKPVGDKIKTQWADKVDPSNPLPEYPRPALVRDQWSTDPKMLPLHTESNR